MQIYEEKKMDNKKILLTGARGFLGKNLLKKLIKMNFNVLEGDIQKRDNSIFLYDDFELSSFDLDVHLGASSSRYDDPNLIFEKNILLTNRIFQEAAKVGTKVIFISYLFEENFGFYVFCNKFFYKILFYLVIFK